LDDLIEGKDMDTDEPWEHIERDLGVGTKSEPSYAAILTKAAA
jgi:hypothetical protein